MIAVIQRVKQASVEYSNTKKETDRGIVVLVGIASNDTDSDVEWIGNKILNLRIFPNEKSEFEKSIFDIKGEILVVPQFTLLGDSRRGRRPDFSFAARPERAKILYERLITFLNTSNLKIASGEFGASMLVKIYNDGPVTIILDSKIHK